MKIRDIVTASYVYNTSSRKHDILTAFESPINKELVTQLIGYLDDSYLKEIPADREPDADSVQDVEEQSDAGDAAESSGSEAPAEHSSSTNSSPAPSDSADSDSLASWFDSSSEDTSASEPDEASTPSDTIEVSTALPATLTSISASIAQQLNSNDITRGVRSARASANELWIYYGDRTNLDTIMEAVIANVPTGLEFNRLARSSNAIVFTCGGN